MGPITEGLRKYSFDNFIYKHVKVCLNFCLSFFHVWMLLVDAMLVLVVVVGSFASCLMHDGFTFVTVLTVSVFVTFSVCQFYHMRMTRMYSGNFVLLHCFLAV